VPDPSDSPNVLILHTDEHRFDCLGCCGHPDVRTPNIDALAADGVRYTESFCPFPVCTPSRYSLISGLYVHEHRGWNNHSTLHPDIATFPRMLREAGYRTAAVGKMHFTPTYLDVGFERMLLAEQDGDGRWDDDYHRYLRDRGLVDYGDLEDQRREYREHARAAYWERFGALPNDLPEEHDSTTWIADRSMEVLDGWGDGPNLLMAGFIRPHHPFNPPGRWATMYDPEALALPPDWTEAVPARDREFHKGYFPNQELTEPAFRRVAACYYACISQIDHHVGRMIERLKARGLYDNTLIVFTADHGDYMGCHHQILKGGLMYDPLIKVPLIVKWPGGRRAGRVSRELVNNVDLAPTLIRAAGLEPPTAMSGQDLDRGVDREIVFAEAAHRMARTGGEKLLLCDPRERSCYFDLSADPLELENLFEEPDRQEEIARLERALAEWTGPDARPFEGKYLDEDAPIIDQPNAVPNHGAHREGVIEYYREKMRTPPTGPESAA
jgi:arylsulfatase A-like enzyme